jgi:hypothetical protein
VSTQEFVPVSAAERHTRHGHSSGLILVENNSALAARVERALFDDHFEVLLVRGDELPVSALESQYAAFQSAGLVVIYSSAAITPEARAKLSGLAAGRFFDLSAVQSPTGGAEVNKNIVSRLRSLGE